MFWVAGREEEAMLWVAECFREGLVTECLQSISKCKRSAVSDWFAQPPPQPWLNSQGRHAHCAPFDARRQNGRAEDVKSLVSELAKVIANEQVLLEQCKDFLSMLAAMQVKHCSLRTHILQLNRVPTD
ncbi:hypothetical protein TEA_025950 [Camellia sinensis var. sinensis]|uniref:Uncharacterized protein n=1 Tax=Camellia sinensis var. sinensis TaxID=542762 RepID=A0A4S4F2Z4_CAMSN|nr:hypothetical protein TEA_025950 [Camellia sinensis var. sinensis]